MSLLTFISLAVVSRKAIKFFTDNNFDDGNYFLSLKKSFGYDSADEINNGDQIVYCKYLFFPLISLFIMISAVILYNWHNYYHLVSVLLYLFFHLAAFALLTSLTKRNILLANIEFTDKSRNDITNCRILKINDDNIRVRVKNRVLLLNKSLVFKIEFVIRELKNKKKKNV